MSDIRAIPGGGQPGHEAAGELAERVKELVYEYSGRLPVATVIGALEIAKFEIMNEQ